MEKTTEPVKAAAPWWKFFNFKRIADATGIQSDKLYNNNKALYNSVTDDEKKKIAKALAPQVKEFFKYLGYDVRIDRTL